MFPDVSPGRITEIFQEELEAAYQHAKDIVLSRSADRDAIPIWGKMAFGDESFVTFIYHKACRLVSMVATKARWCDDVDILEDYKEASKRRRETEDKIDDELLDIMNYAAFNYANRRTFERLKAERSERNDMTSS